MTEQRPNVICPRCSTQHHDSARFCPSCGFDYRAAIEGKTKRQWSGGEKTLAGLIVLVAVIGFLYVTGQASIPALDGSRTGSSLPPAGTIWFGSTFDADTLALANRTSSVGTNEAFAMVASLRQSVNGSEMALRVYFDGALVNTSAADAEGSGDAWGWSLGPLFEPGEWRYEVTDIGGNVLAAGSVTATE
jgi:hypothetical protein